MNARNLPHQLGPAHSDWQPHHSLQACKVSALNLHKTGILQYSRGDFRPIWECFGSLSESPEILLAAKSVDCGLKQLVTRRDSGDLTAWLATQWHTHPAPLEFPANREFYREFFKNPASGTPEIPKSAPVAQLPMPIPYSTKQGIISVEQEILAQEQGISATKIVSA